MKYRVIAPTKQGKQVVFSFVDSPRKIVFDYIRAINSPKHFLLPNREVIIRWRYSDEGLLLEEPRVNERIAFLGLHPCDANAIAILDKVMLEEPYDPYYSVRRRNSLIIVLDCIESDDYCFCESVDSRTPWEGAYDLWLVPIGEGYAITYGSSKGLEIIKQLELNRTEEPKIHKGINKRRMNKLDLEAFWKLYEHPVWSKLSDDCLLCGACMAACPTCTCFDVVDESDLDLSEGRRIRVWDSCIFRIFTMVAGGRVVRREPTDRFKHRYYHKFLYFKERYGVYGCTGCGRCALTCPRHIDPVKVIGEVLKNA